MAIHSRLIGAILLITGTTVGAGILAMPIAIGRAGFIPSLCTMCFCWVYLAYAAFCILEVALALPAKSNLISMATATCGRWGKAISWVAYLFLLYALNTAYIAVSANIFQNIIQAVTGYAASQILCILPLLVIFGLLLRQGMHIVDVTNRMCMVGLGLSFVFLVVFAMTRLDVSYLTAVNWSAALPSLSVAVTAFGYHIIIPSLVTYLHRSVKELSIAIWIGSLLPLVIYTIWQLAILGLVPLQGESSIEAAFAAGHSGTDLLKSISSNPLVTYVAEAFAFFVIITSFLGVSISLFDFLADGLKIEKRAGGKWKLFFFTFVPPLYFALTYPRIFFIALEYAGAYGVVILLAIVPACMVWMKRYVLHLPSPYTVPGGKLGLLVFLLISLSIMIM